MRAVRFERRKREQFSVTCSAVDFEPKPLGPAVPAKYLSVAFMDLPYSLLFRIYYYYYYCKDKYIAFLIYILLNPCYVIYAYQFGPQTTLLEPTN